jgi:hypothetical protein
MTDIVTKRRLAEAIVVMQEHGDGIGGLTHEAAVTITIEGLEKEVSMVMEAAKCVQAIVAAYYGAGDLDMEMLVRSLINMQAEKDKDKRFELPVLDGAGIGKWELVVRKMDRETAPRVFVPPRLV